ncbi:RNA binding metal dependent phosphohydrolase [Hydrogenobaculum sp. Y04AAS1]|uniref:ribonuclease Y n=1 Tax=Hydrogenobaculum sp. (strain Y04AAS1) TaxID=380749 RepID=UPI00015BCCC8|nr:RNA binding metal dependent phosphohydrolase [Hydrogenobaculum sp. Y04AAS1]HCT66127.1 ribonuclease Y [Hydrogenobaculum sp.]
METVVIGILSILVLVLSGFGFLAFKKLSEKQVVNLPNTSEESKILLEEAKRQADAILEEAKKQLEYSKELAEREASKYMEFIKKENEKLGKEKEAIKKELELRKEELEKDYIRKQEELSSKEQSLLQRERSLESKEINLERKLQSLEKKEEELYAKERELRELEKALQKREKEIEQQYKNVETIKSEIEELKNKELLELQRIASLTKEEAYQEILRKAEEEAKIESIRIAKAIEEKAKEEAEREAKRIITTSIQRLSPEIAINYSTSTIELPSNEFKGRIIGREGRNIRAFEILTGVDIIIDDTPDTVTLSSFDPMRREIAKQALGKLIIDGRIHPARIEEVVEEVKKEMDNNIRKLGEETVMELGIHDMNPGLYYYIGKLYYRTSYSQNVLLHSKEVATIAGLMAAELGLNEKAAKRAGLLHDIGKAISNEMGGSHTDIGIELCKKYKEPDYVLNAIKAHHEEEPVKYPEVALVCAADALSAARPGARRESLEAYIKRLEKLEEIVKSFPGVSNVYAMQAGREVRVIVSPSELTDEQAYDMSKKIAKKIEEEMDYPGNIKVVVIRENRFVEYAR